MPTPRDHIKVSAIHSCPLYRGFLENYWIIGKNGKANFTCSIYYVMQVSTPANKCLRIGNKEIKYLIKTTLKKPL